VTRAVCTAVSRGTLNLAAFDNSGRWWLGAMVALMDAGYTAAEAVTDAELMDRWRQLHAAGKV